MQNYLSPSLLPDLCIYSYLMFTLKGSCVYMYVCIYIYGPSSSVGIATDYGLDGPGLHPGGDEIFRQSRPAMGPTQPPVQWVPDLSWW